MRILRVRYWKGERETYANDVVELQSAHDVYRYPALSRLIEQTLAAEKIAEEDILHISVVKEPDADPGTISIWLFCRGRELTD